MHQLCALELHYGIFGLIIDQNARKGTGTLTKLTHHARCTCDYMIDQNVRALTHPWVKALLTQMQLLTHPPRVQGICLTIDRYVTKDL